MTSKTVYTLLVIAGIALGAWIAWTTGQPDPVLGSLQASEIPLTAGQELTASLQEAGQTLMTLGRVLLGGLIGAVIGISAGMLASSPLAAAITGTRTTRTPRRNTYKTYR